MEIKDAVDKLSEPIEEPTPPIEGLGLPEPTDEPDEPVSEEGEVTATTEPKDKAEEPTIRDAVVEALAEVANQMPAPLPPQPTQRQITRYEAEKQRLKESGVPEEALANFEALQVAHTEEVLKQIDQRNQQQQVQQYQAALWQAASEAIDEAGAAVSTIKNAGQGAKADLVNYAFYHIMNDPNYSGTKRAIDSFAMPSKNEFKKVAAKVVDKYCDDNGITKTPKGINLKSSKPDTTADTVIDVRDMPRKAQQIYQLTLETTGDKKKALKRARSVM